ncbi:hypothetical protein [Elizabethkingia anophelis]|uniref:hypothetical protein n=1 Tax=Elizabethkingia anophelis TaxID=1117645 RepID=UPI0038915A05
MKIIKGHPRVRGFTADDNDERYKIHRVLKKLKIDYNARSRKIFNSTSELEEIKILIEKFGYIIENDLEFKS